MNQDTETVCETHGKGLDIIYPEKDKRLCKYLCGCVIYKILQKDLDRWFSMTETERRKKVMELFEDETNRKE